MISLGVLGSIFVLTFDWIVGKPVNAISGPKSITALIICDVIVIIGVLLIGKKK
jgi:hypothetical protein